MDEVVKEVPGKWLIYLVYRNMGPVYIEACVFADDVVISKKAENHERNLKVWTKLLAE